MKKIALFIAPLVLCAVLFAIVIPKASAQAPDAKVTAIHTLMEKTHMRQVELETMTNMIMSARERPELKEVPSEIWDRFQLKLDSVSGQLIDSAVNIYAKYFTLEDINELIRIYDNPVMQKSMKITPQLVSEMAMVGQRMGRETMEQLMQQEQPAAAPASTEPNGAAQPAEGPKPAQKPRKSQKK